MLFACLLCSCSLFQNGIEAPAESTDSSSADPSQEQLISVMNGNVDLDALSLDELLKLYDEFLKGGNDALNDGAENDLLYRDIYRRKPERFERITYIRVRNNYCKF